MKIIVIGLGSMGRRRIRLLSEHKDIELYGIDSQKTRCQEVMDKCGIICYSSIAEAVAKERPDAAVVSTSPLSHAAIVRECLFYNLHVFTEINLVPDGYEENMALAKEKGLVLFLSSTFLYRKENKCIIEKVHKADCPLNYIYHVGQYLPDWHPWESYKDYFIADKRTNGCREIMAIELPWIVTAFGPIVKVSALKSKNTDLHVNYNDNYLITLEHESGHKGVLAVDVVTRKSIRHIDIYGERFQMSWDGTADSLMVYDVDRKEMTPIIFDNAAEHIEGYATFIIENPYREELNSFLDLIKAPSQKPIWDFERDFTLLAVIDEIEK